MKKPIPSSVVLFTALLIVPLAGCGRGDNQTQSGQTPAAGGAAQPPASGRLVEITGNDTMKFSVTEIRAKPGEALSVKLTNVGTLPKFSMGHNWVLLRQGTDVDAFVNEAMNAATTNYVPAALEKEIIAHTKLLGPKETDTVTFNAPSEPGRYLFLCSFPGHYQVGMRGELIVE